MMRTVIDKAVDKLSNRNMEFMEIILQRVYMRFPPKIAYALAKALITHGLDNPGQLNIMAYAAKHDKALVTHIGMWSIHGTRFRNNSPQVVLQTYEAGILRPPSLNFGGIEVADLYKLIKRLPEVFTYKEVDMLKRDWDRQTSKVYLSDNEELFSNYLAAGAFADMSPPVSLTWKLTQELNGHIGNQERGPEGQAMPHTQEEVQQAVILSRALGRRSYYYPTKRHANFTTRGVWHDAWRDR